MLCLCTSRTILMVRQLAGRYPQMGSLTSVDAVQPSGNIQALGSVPWMIAGLKQTIRLRLAGREPQLTSMVKQWPGSMYPGSSFTGKRSTSQHASNRVSLLTTVHNPWLTVEDRSNAVTSKLRRNTVRFAFQEFVYSSSNCFERLSRPTSRNCCFQGLVGDGN